MSSHAAPVSGQGTWESTLEARDFDGNTSTIEGWYDTALNITWLADANYAGAAMTWADSNSWVAGLNFNGITGWRLPDTNPIDGTTADDDIISFIGTEDRVANISAPGTLYAGSTASEMAHMFYNTLGNLSNCDPATSTVSTCSTQTGSGLTNTGPFENLSSEGYWSATEYVPLAGYVWRFNFNDGAQTRRIKSSSSLSWAVHTGDVGTPILDSDNDGLPDNIEDSNDNGIVDAGETDPFNPDSDNDGALDGQEDT